MDHIEDRDRLWEFAKTKYMANECIADDIEAPLCMIEWNNA